MSDDIQKLKTDFDNLIHYRVDLNTKRVLLEHKLEEIKSQYTDLIKNNQKKIYLHCLDALFFQYKILRVEFEQYEKTMTLVYNRMYGEYYKLYTLIQTQTREDGVVALSVERLPVYKDLELTTIYEMEDVIGIHGVIIDLLRQLNDMYIANRTEIERRNSTMCVGSSIAGFITTLTYENRVMQQNITLYSEYLSFYHSSQRDYLTTLLSKINAFICEIDSDILVNHVSNAKPDLAQYPVVKEEPVLEEPVKKEELVKEELVKEEPVLEELVKEEPVLLEEMVKEEPVLLEVEVKQDIMNENKSEAKEVQTYIVVDSVGETDTKSEPKCDIQIEEKAEEITTEYRDKVHKKSKKR
jgi:hypothetical protein